MITLYQKVRRYTLSCICLHMVRMYISYMHTQRVQTTASLHGPRADDWLMQLKFGNSLRFRGVRAETNPAVGKGHAAPHGPAVAADSCPQNPGGGALGSGDQRRRGAQGGGRETEGWSVALKPYRRAVVLIPRRVSCCIALWERHPLTGTRTQTPHAHHMPRSFTENRGQAHGAHTEHS